MYGYKLSFDLLKIKIMSFLCIICVTLDYSGLCRCGCGEWFFMVNIKIFNNYKREFLAVFFAYKL